MTCLYCDCFSGISGDMFLGALLDAGLPVETLSTQLKKLNLPEFQEAGKTKVFKGSLQATLLQMDIHQPAEDDQHHPHTHHRHYRDICQLIKYTG